MGLCATASAKAQISNFNGFYAGVLGQEFNYQGPRYGISAVVGFRHEVIDNVVAGAEVVGRYQRYSPIQDIYELEGRAILGYEPSDIWLLYGLVGATYRDLGRVRTETMATFGAGVETALNEMLHLRGEFAYSPEFRAPAAVVGTPVTTYRFSAGLIFQIN